MSCYVCARHTLPDINYKTMFARAAEIDILLQIAKELTDVIQKQQQLLGLEAEGWQNQAVPRTLVLQQAGYNRLANQIQNYGRYRSSTARGRRAFAADVGWTLAAGAVAEAGTYQASLLYFEDLSSDTLASM